MLHKKTRDFLRDPSFSAQMFRYRYVPVELLAAAKPAAKMLRTKIAIGDRHFHRPHQAFLMGDFKFCAMRPDIVSQPMPDGAGKNAAQKKPEFSAGVFLSRENA
jgi:hypothetical protein